MPSPAYHHLSSPLFIAGLFAPVLVGQGRWPATRTLQMGDLTLQDAYEARSFTEATSALRPARAISADAIRGSSRPARCGRRQEGQDGAPDVGRTHVERPRPGAAARWSFQLDYLPSGILIRSILGVM